MSGEFRIGRKFARHFYPRTQGGSQASFARNYASGATASPLVTTSGIELPWTSIASGAPAGVDVPITPVSSGILAIDGVISFANESNAETTVQLVVRVDGVGMVVPNQLQVTVLPNDGTDDGAFAARISLVTPAVSLNTEHDVSVFLLAGADNAVRAVAASCTIQIQEIPPATG